MTRKRSFARKRSGIKYDGMIKVKLTVTKEMLVDAASGAGKSNFDVSWGS